MNILYLFAPYRRHVVKRILICEKYVFFPQLADCLAIENRVLVSDFEKIKKIIPGSCFSKDKRYFFSDEQTYGYYLESLQKEKEKRNEAKDHLTVLIDRLNSIPRDNREFERERAKSIYLLEQIRQFGLTDRAAMRQLRQISPMITDVLDKFENASQYGIKSESVQMIITHTTAALETANAQLYDLYDKHFEKDAREIDADIIVMQFLSTKYNTSAVFSDKNR